MMTSFTVEDVFLRCLPTSGTASITAAQIVQAAKAWLTQRRVLPSTTTAEDFFAQPDTFGWAAFPDFLLYWFVLVTSKFLKLSASEYAYFHLPSEADTMWLTGMTAQLVKLGHLKSAVQQQLQMLSSTNASLPWRWGAEVDTVSILHALLFVLVYYTRPATAVRVLEGIFLTITREQDEIFTVVPQLLSYFVPHVSFQSITFRDRIAMLADQLVQRGFQFSAGLTFTSPNSAPRVVDLAPMKVDEVVRRVLAVSSTTEVRIRCRIESDIGDVEEDGGMGLKEYLSVVVRVCRTYYQRCRQATKKQLKNVETLLKLAPPDMRTMKELHKILRFAEPYSERFQKLGIWHDILRSEGWVPMQVIDEQLSLLRNSILKDLPSGQRMEIVESLLRQHDNMQRYQVAACSVRGSAFRGQRCARSVYGHALRNPPLYRYVICRPECLLSPTDANALASLPMYGWVLLGGRPQRALGAHPSIMPLFDNVPFCVVMPAEAIGAFRDYDETTSTAKRYDEKLRAPQVYFAEVYLRAIARDGAALVPDRDAVSNSGGEGALKSSSDSRTYTPRHHDTASVIDELASISTSHVSRAGSPAVVAPKATTTEVYSRVRDEADARTQRWYVFPQYFAKKATAAEAKGTAAPAGELGEQAAGNDQTQTPEQQQQHVPESAEVRRHAPKTDSNIGLPKIFLTGRLAELRELKPSEESRHLRLPHSTRELGRHRGNSGQRAADGDQQEGGKKEEEEEEEKSSELQNTGSAPQPCYRGTQHEFDAAVDASGDDTADAERSAAERTPLPVQRLCEYIIDTSRAAPTLLPPVVARVVQRDDGTAQRSRDDGDVVVRLSRSVPAATLYQRCFPPSRLQSVFSDYVTDPFIQIEAALDEKDDEAEAAAAAEWQLAAGGGDKGTRRLGQWGLSPSFIPPARAANLLQQQQQQHLDQTRGAFDVAPLRAALEAFIASRQMVCVLQIRVASEAGVSLSGCRQGIDELKHFAKEKALTYAKVGRASSQDRTASQGKDGEADDTLGERVAVGREEVGPDYKVYDWELIEFRKHVAWSLRDLDHILSELQLTRSDVPYSTLTTALTRECEDRRDNYELLEFIGDAVMDFLVAADACLLAHAAFAANMAAGDPVVVGGGEKTRVLATSPLSQVKWTPEASRVWLPCMYSVTDSSSSAAARAMPAVMRDVVTSVLCRNRVIAELLPPTVARHFCDDNYPNLSVKVRADVFEAIIGAAYRSGVGLDRLRQLLRRLFSFLPAATRTAAAAGGGGGAVSTYAELQAALLTCPYLVEGDALQVENVLLYRTKQLFELTPGLLETDAVSAGAHKEEDVNTHLVASLLPRIQAKDYATMFTTGRAYAYRRLFAFDTARVHNRVLHLFSKGSVGFMNEIFTDTIHLVLDIDKVSLRAWGLLPILWDWYASRYPCQAGMFALDCSGQTWANKERKWKDSCHVHFPQVTVNVRTWDALMSDVRGAVVAALEGKQTRLSDVFAGHAGEYRVWLCRSAVLRGLAAVGAEPCPHMWTYCDAETLLQLARTCRGVRQSVLEHVTYVTHTLEGMARFAELASEADIFVGDAGSELVVVEHSLTQQRLLLPLQWLGMCREPTRTRVYPPAETWVAVIDQGLAESRKLRLYLNDKCDTVYGVESRPLVLDTLLLHNPGTPRNRSRVRGSPIPVEGDVLQRKPFRHYRPLRAIRRAEEEVDVFAAHRARQEAAKHETRLTIRRLHGVDLHTACSRNNDRAEAAAAELIAPLVWDVQEFGDDLAQGWVVECAHRSTLTLSSLRTAEYRGTDAQLYNSWVDCKPDEDTAEHSQRMPMLFGDGQNDRLPSFENVFERRVALPGQPTNFEWMAWFNFFKMRTKGVVFLENKKQTIRVWSPAWWAFDAQQCTATFCIATEPVLRLRNMNSLSAALSPPGPFGGGGLERVAQLLMPHISTKNKMPVKVREPHVYLLFVEKPGTIPVLALNSAPSAAALPQPPATAVPSPQAQLVEKDNATVTPPSPVVAGVLSANSLASPRVTSGNLPRVVCLAPWLQKASTSTEAAWLCEAVSFVYTATAARTELGSTPLVLCDSASVFADVCAAVAQSAAGPQSTWLPYILPLQDTTVLERYVSEAAATARGVPRHVFVFSSSASGREESALAAASPTAPRTALATYIQKFYRILTSAVKEPLALRRYFYVHTEAVRDSIHAALSPSARVV